jgi:tetratricopeptide (TPR) repeat protein
VLQALKDAGAGGTTIVLVAGDHGEGLGDHGESTHGLLLYEPTIHVPLVVRAPWSTGAGSHRRDVVSLVDIAPTLASLAGIRLAGPLDGTDLFASTPPDAGRAVFAESLFAAEEFHWAPLACVRRGDAKWISAPEPERFDLHADPGERDNTAGRDTAGDAVLSALLGSIASSASARQGAGAPSSLDDETRARLQALGYVAGGGTGEPASSAAGPGRDPKDAIADYDAYVRGTDLLEAGEDAADVFERLVAGDPENPEFRLRLGQAYRARGDRAKAESVYRELIRAYPDFYLAYRRLGSLLSYEGRSAEARDLWLAVRARSTAFVGVDARLVEALLATGETSRALDVAKGALAKSPEDVELLVLAGRGYERAGDAAAALESYTAALDLKPADLEALDGALALLKRLGRRDEATALADDCLKRSSGDAAVSARRAAI